MGGRGASGCTAVLLVLVALGSSCDVSLANDDAAPARRCLSEKRQEVLRKTLRRYEALCFWGLICLRFSVCIVDACEELGCWEYFYY